MSVKERLAQLNKTGSSLPIAGFAPPQQHQLSPSKTSNISNKFNVENDAKESSLHSSNGRVLSPPPFSAKTVHYSSTEGNDASNNEGESLIKKTNSHNEAHMSKPIINAPGRRRPSRQSLTIPSDHILTKADIEAVESVDAAAAASKSSTETNSPSTQQKSDIPSWKRHQSDSAVDTSSSSHIKQFGSSINSSNNVSNNIFKSNSNTFKGSNFSSGSSHQSHLPSTNSSSPVHNPAEAISQSSNSEKSLIERLEKMVTEQDKRIKMLEDELQYMRSEMKKHGAYQERQIVSDAEKSNVSIATQHDEDHQHHKPSFVSPPSSPPKSIIQTTPQYGTHTSPAIKSYGSISSTTSSSSSTQEPPAYSQGKENQIKLASISSIRDKFNKPSKPNDEEKIQPSSSFSSQNQSHANDKWFNQKKDEDKAEHIQPIQPTSTVSGSSSSYVSTKESVSSHSDVDTSTSKDVHTEDTKDADDEYEKLEKEQEVLHDTKDIHDGDTNDGKDDSDDLSL